MARVTIDSSDVKKLAATLDLAGGRMPATVRPVVQRAALNIKRAAKERIGRGPYLPAYAGSITYDTAETATSVTAEIGPDKGKAQGALGNLLEYGSEHNAPIPHLAPSLEEESPRLEHHLEDAVLKALGL